MGFLPEKKADWQDEATAMYSQLYTVVGKNRKKQISVKTWITEFQLLIKDVGFDTALTVLHWFCKHHKDEFVPEVSTATGFRQKFAQIQAAMLRKEGELPDTQDSDFAATLVQNYTWPPELVPVLPALVKATRENWKKFTEFVRRVYCSHQGDQYERQQLFLKQVVLEKHAFVDQWFHMLNRSVGFRDHYFGDPRWLAFRPDSDRFKLSFWKDWSVFWCNNSNSFDELLAELIEEMKS